MDIELEKQESAKDRISECNSDVNLSIKKPKRVLHFSDGILEEFSDTEDEVDQNKNKVLEVLSVDEVNLKECLGFIEECSAIDLFLSFRARWTGPHG